MADMLSSIEKLASWQQLEEEHFERFLTSLRDVLRTKSFSLRERNGILATYLDWRKETGLSAGSGDEQPVVDLLVRQILGALGYADADLTYNENLGNGGRAAPDYTVRVREFLGSTPVFLVEDKATSVLDLQRLRRSGEAEETPLGQLRRYVLSGAVHGRAGLLCNGWKLEAWEFGPEADTRLIQIDLYGLSRGAEAGELPKDQMGALRALWSRFSRAAFERANELTLLSAAVPPQPPEWRDRLHQVLAESGRPQDVEEELLRYYEAVWKERALDVSRAPERLVEALRGLIHQFAEDVHHQLTDALARYRDYDAEKADIAKRSKLPQYLQRLALRQPSFELSKEDFEAKLLAPVAEWCRRPRLEQMKERITEWVEAVGPFAKTPNGAPSSQLGLGTTETAVEKQDSRIQRTAENGAKRVLDELKSNLEDLCRSALEDSASQQQLEAGYRATLRTANAYQTWAQRISSSVLVGQPEEEYRSEFALQTAYVYIVRLLLVRICEDKEIFRRKLSDGGLIIWSEVAARYLDYASGRSYEYLTRMAYECAQNVYVHFYGASELFDWYRMDEKMLLRALLVLNGFNLASIDTDIIGAVYGRYLEEGKHEQGRYYTPKPLVTVMLDTAGYRGPNVVGCPIADLACGSGSFLVEACRRLLAEFRGPDGIIAKANLKAALEEVQRSIYGLELNPFACYLAETNLLIQVLDLVRRAKEEDITLAVDRFRIYCTDSLLVDERLSGATLLLLGEDAATAELIKSRSGPFQDGFEFLVGNPPYVRADEDAPSYQSYRRLLEHQSWFTTRHLKWDLYVPFVEQYYRLLADTTGARCSLVTIESIATAPYAAKLRELLCARSRLNSIAFLRGLRLFEDAPWQDNLVMTFSKTGRAEGDPVARYIGRSGPGGQIELDLWDELPQLESTPEQIFNLRADLELGLEDTIRLDRICYVSKGMVLHSNERLAQGELTIVPQSYRADLFGESVVEDMGQAGKRIKHRKFKRDDLVADAADDIHTRPFVDVREMRRGGLGSTLWIEYGEHTRCPRFVSRPTFPELYDRPKIMFGTFTGIAVDDGSGHGHRIVSHSTTLAMLWHRLEAVENRSLTSALKELREDPDFDLSTSRSFSEWYICALTLSTPIQDWLSAHRRSMKDHVYPEDIKAIPVKIISRDQQRPFILLEQERHRLWRELVGLEAEGFKIGSRVEIPVHGLLRRFQKEHPEIEYVSLFQAAALTFRFEPDFHDKDLKGVRAAGGEVVLKRECIARVADAVGGKESVAALLAQVFASLPGTFADRQTVDRIPRTEAGLLALAAYLDEQEQGVRRRLARIEEIQSEIDRMAWKLYRPREEHEQ